MAMAALVLMLSGEGLAVLMGASILVTLFGLMWWASRPQQRPVVRDQSLTDFLSGKRFSTTEAARHAVEQSRHRPDYDAYTYTLRDIGMIVDESSREGLKLRQARFISLDDEAVRPYIIVAAPRRFQPQRVLVRYEINDATGKRQFVYEMEYWMRPGENLLLPDYRLPLKGNNRIERTGKWDLQVWINDGLVGIHTFSVSPSLEERRRQFSQDGEAQRAVRLDNDPLPLSLDELLSAQQQHRSSGGSSS
jgi:hypothetical protein